MTLRFTVLGSGSSGNACLLEVDGFGLLIDAGLGPRQIAGRLGAVGGSWEDVDAALLTHTHSDHWKDRTLARLLQRQIPLHCHLEHADRLRRGSKVFATLERAGLVRSYGGGEEFSIAGELVARPVRLSHDAGATFGFRFHRGRSLFHSGWTMGYAADLGVCDADLAAAFTDVDLLALEFNHDVPMLRASGRPASLIARVLGAEGHLSNDQAAEFLGHVLRASRPERPKTLVQLHLSRQCNRPHLAAAAAHQATAALEQAVRVYTSSQHEPVRIVPE